MDMTEPLGSLLDRLIIIGKVNRAFKVPLIWWGVIIFAGYYMLPLLLCAVEGVLIGAPTNTSQANLWLNELTYTVGRRAISTPYLKDLTHLLMAIVVSVGGNLCIVALSESIRIYDTVSDREILKADANSIDAERKRLERLVQSRGVLAPILLIAGSCGLALYYNGRSAAGWWGNPQFGPAGMVMACGVALVIFYGLHALYMLAVTQYSVGRLVSHGIHLRPFHPDGCNGFSRLGNLLLLLLLLCASCVTAAWITIHHGYLKIEEFPGIWLAALGIVVFIPVIVIHPLVHVSIQIRRAQLLRLSPVEGMLNDYLKRTEDQLSSPDMCNARLEDLKNLRDLHQTGKDIYETNVFPFNRKVASALSIGYVAQAVALATEIVGKFK
jgi:hypothetical protein